MTRSGSKPDAQTLAQVEAAYSEWGGQLLRFAVRLCGNRDDAEDIVVESFAHAYRKWDTFHGTGSRLGWLYGIAVNRHRMSRRKLGRRPETLTDELSTLPPNVLDRIVIEQAVIRMPVEWRESFLLVKSEGLTHREAAEVLRRPLGTVLYEVFQAVRLLREELMVKESDAMPSRPCEAKS